MRTEVDRIIHQRRRTCQDRAETRRLRTGVDILILKLRKYSNERRQILWLPYFSEAFVEAKQSPFIT